MVEHTEIHSPKADTAAYALPNQFLTAKGRIRWTLLAQHPDMLKAYFMSEARRMIDQGMKFNAPGLRRVGKGGFLDKVFNHYPDGLSALQNQLGMAQGQHPPGYWKKPEAIEGIKQEATNVYHRNGRLTSGDLNRRWRYYPGGLNNLHKDITAEPKRKPLGFWTEERIRQAACEFYEREGRISQRLLVAKGWNTLAVYITRRYPGGWRKLREDASLPLVKKDEQKDIISPEQANEQLRRLLEGEI